MVEYYCYDVSKAKYVPHCTTPSHMILRIIRRTTDGQRTNECHKIADFEPHKTGPRHVGFLHRNCTRLYMKSNEKTMVQQTDQMSHIVGQIAQNLENRTPWVFGLSVNQFFASILFTIHYSTFYA